MPHHNNQKDEISLILCGFSSILGSGFLSYPVKIYDILFIDFKKVETAL